MRPSASRSRTEILGVASTEDLLDFITALIEIKRDNDHWRDCIRLFRLFLQLTDPFPLRNSYYKTFQDIKKQTCCNIADQLFRGKIGGIMMLIMSNCFMNPDYKDDDVVASLILPSTGIFNTSNISAVFGIVFMISQKGRFLLLTIKNERGLDIPGGHVETMDKTIEDALSREISEEANQMIKPTKIQPLAVASLISNKENYRDKMLWFGVADLKNVQNVGENWVAPENFISDYKQIAFKNFMSWLLKQAERKYEHK